MIKGSSIGTWLTTSHADIINSTISNNSNGVYATLSDLSFSYNVVENNTAGLNISSSQNTSIFRNTIRNNTIGVWSDTPLNMTKDWYGNFWGRTTYPYFVAGTDSNADNVTDPYPFRRAGDWNIENRTMIAADTGGSIRTVDGKAILSIPTSALRNNTLIVAALKETGKTAITERSIDNITLHYDIAPYEVMYLPNVTAIPLPKPMVLSVDYGDMNASRAHIIHYDGMRGWIAQKVDINESARKLTLALYNFSEYALGESMWDLRTFDNSTPSISVSWSGSVLTTTVVDNPQQVIQKEFTRGRNNITISADGRYELWIPRGADLSSAKLWVSAETNDSDVVFNGTFALAQPTYVVLIDDLYNAFNVSGPTEIDLTSSIRSGLANCSAFNATEAGFCAFEISISNLTGGNITISNLTLNYNYASGAKIPDRNFTGVITSLIGGTDGTNITLTAPLQDRTLMMIMPKHANATSASVITLTGLNISGYPTKINFTIGNVTVWSYDRPTEPFTGSVSLSAPFAEAISIYLDGCVADGDENCVVPLVLSGDRGGIRISNIAVYYEASKAFSSRPGRTVGPVHVTVYPR
jgi:hypothetical protein